MRMMMVSLIQPPGLCAPPTAEVEVQTGSDDRWIVGGRKLPSRSRLETYKPAAKTSNQVLRYNVRRLSRNILSSIM